MKIRQSGKKTPCSSLHSISATHKHAGVMCIACRWRISPDATVTRQSLRGDSTSSRRGLIGCQGNLILSACAASRYDVCGTSIRGRQRALARRRRLGSGHFSSAWMSQILPILCYQCLVRGGLCKISNNTADWGDWKTD